VASSLNPLQRALERIVTALGEVGSGAALVGGLAVSARAEPRTTRDVDLAISVPSDDEAEQLVFHLQGRGYVVRALLEQEQTRRMATVRLIRDSEPAVYVDLLFASSGIEPEIVSEAEHIAILEDLTMRVATRAHLIALKVLARDDRNRPQDWDDLRALLRDASEHDIRRARDALDLIQRRGYNRSRNLGDDLERAIADTTR
jgi:predicted nucleotidyltransferase